MAQEATSYIRISLTHKVAVKKYNESTLRDMFRLKDRQQLNIMYRSEGLRELRLMITLLQYQWSPQLDM